jgi:hypothetical protein
MQRDMMTASYLQYIEIIGYVSLKAEPNAQDV